MTRRQWFGVVLIAFGLGAGLTPTLRAFPYSALAVDPFAGESVRLADPPVQWAAVTPSDDTDLTVPSRCIWVGGDGNINAITIGGTTLVFVGAKAGTIIPGRFTRIKSTSTTATSLNVGW